jgi:hypothetical protein
VLKYPSEAVYAVAKGLFLLANEPIGSIIRLGYASLSVRQSSQSFLSGRMTYT